MSIITEESYGELRYLLDKVKEDKAKEHELLMESNSLLRSAFSIAERNGKDTNWEAFRNQLDKALKKQHPVLYPEGYAALMKFKSENKE